MKRKWFSLILSAVFAVISVSAVATTERVSSVAATNTHSAYAPITNQGSGLVIEPTTIFEPQNYGDISTSGATSIVLTPDENMRITFADGERSLQSVFNLKLKSRFIPVVRLNENTVDAFITWMKETYTISDIMAISSDLTVIQKLYQDEVCSIVNTVYDLTDKTISLDRYWAWQYLGKANAAGCNILMLDASDPNLSVAAEYISAMSKVCWGYAENKTEAVGAVTSGCYGIVSSSAQALTDAMNVFEKDGFARAQYIAAHRGITAYCNEQSLTAVAAGVNEGATHLELDIQITKDRQILICHNSESNATASKNGMYFATATAAQMRSLTLVDYSDKYQDTFPTLEEVIELVKDTDMILVLELKLDNGSNKAANELKAIETLKALMEKHPEMEGRYITITFFEPYARGMKEHMPEIPVGYLGAGAAEAGSWVGHAGMTEYAKKIAFLRKYNMVLDETYSETTNNTAQMYLARGYVQNSWTFEDTSHFAGKLNVSTTNAAEECSMAVKTISSAPLTLTEEQYNSKKATVTCTTYCGWKKQLECEIIEVERSAGHATVLLYYAQPDKADGVLYGLYSNPVSVTVS